MQKQCFGSLPETRSSTRKAKTTSLHVMHKTQNKDKTLLLRPLKTTIMTNWQVSLRQFMVYRIHPMQSWSPEMPQAHSFLHSPNPRSEKSCARGPMICIQFASRNAIGVAIYRMGNLPRCKNPGKMWKGNGNGPKPEMTPKNGGRNGKNGQNPIQGSIFPFRAAIFWAISGLGLFSMSFPHFSGIFASGRFPIL